VKIIEDAGCSLLTVHGRTKEQNKQKVGKCDWEMIKKIKRAVKIPVYANGGIYNYEDAVKCLELTGVDGVMSSESLLENPALFSGKVYNLDQIAWEYLELCKIYQTDSCYIRPHLFKFLFTGLQRYPELREELGQAKTMNEFERIVLQVRDLRINEAPESKLGWYVRYIPDEDRDSYNDYRVSLKKSLTNGKNKDHELKDKENRKPVPVEEKAEEEIDLNLFFE